MTKQSAAVFRPIGRVEDGVIRVHRRWAAGLDGIDGFSHLIVLYWLDQAHRPELKLHPKGIHRIPAWVKLLDQAETDPLRKYA